MSRHLISVINCFNILPTDISCQFSCHGPLNGDQDMKYLKALILHIDFQIKFYMNKENKNK